MQKKRRGAVLSLRLPASVDAKLAEKAELVGMTRGVYARLLIIEALTDTDGVRLHDEIGTVRRKVELLQRNLEVALTALLVDAGKADLKEAEGFVRERLAK
jgi:hypothetical protein